MTIQKLLTIREAAARLGLQRIADSHGWQLFCKPKFSDIFEIRNSGIEDDDFDYASRAHVDFVLTRDDFTPILVLEVDATEPREDHVGRAHRKDRLAHRANLPFMRIDVSRLPLEILDSRVEKLVLAYLAPTPILARDCGCASDALCFDPSCLKEADLESAIRAKLKLSRKTKLSRTVEPTDYSTAITFILRSASSERTLWKNSTIATITTDGGISHTDLAVSCSVAKMTAMIAQWQSGEIDGD